MRLVGLIFCFLVWSGGAWAQCSSSNLSACPTAPFNSVAANTLSGNASAATATGNGVTQTLATWMSSLFSFTATVGTNTALKALVAGQYSSAHRLGFTTAGDGGAATYTWSSSNCATNGLVNDNGACVQPIAGSGSWIWNPPSGTVVPEMFGAKCDGASNDTTAIQAAINAVQLLAAGQNILNINAKTCIFAPPLLVAGPAPIRIRGQGPFVSQLKETSGQSANLLNIGYTAPTSSQTQGVTIEHLGFIGNSPSGGYAISAHHVANLHVTDVYIGQTWGGIEDEQSNTDYYDDVWGYTVGSNSQAFLWWVNPAAQAAGGRSDQLYLRNIGINAGFYGNDGFVWKGLANTLNAQNIAFLQTNHGFWVDASLNTTGQFPAFASVYNLQVEGAQSAACEIDGGRQMYFTDGFCHSEYGETGPGGTQGNNDAAALLINPDYTASVTSDLKFEDMSIGLSASYGGLMQAQGVYFSNVSWRGSSLKTPGGAPSVMINGTSGQGSADYGFVNNKFCGIFGDTAQNNYGVVRGTFVGSTRIVSADFDYCQTGEIIDNSAIFDFVASSSTDRNGFALPDSKGTFVGNALPTVSSCGTAPTITGNDLDFFVVAGTGSFTSCTVTLASSNSANNNGAGPLKANFIQPNGTQGSYYLVSATGAALVFSLTGGGNMAGTGFNVHLVQAYSAH